MLKKEKNYASTERDRVDSRKDPIFSSDFDKKFNKKDSYESFLDKRYFF